MAIPSYDNVLAYVVDAQSEGRRVNLINMSGLINWSLGPGARAAPFSGMPMSPAGRPYVEVQMHKTLMKMTFKRLGIEQAEED